MVFSTVSGFCEYCGRTTPTTFCKSVVRVMGNVCFGTTMLSSIWWVGYANLGLEALLEPHIVYAQSFRKPDIVAWDTDQSYMIDVAVTRDDEHPD